MRHRKELPGAVISFSLMSILLVDDFELISLLKAQVTIMFGLIAVYGLHQVVCRRNYKS